MIPARRTCLIRVHAIADLANGPDHPEPSCQIDNPGYVGELPSALLHLTFAIPNDYSLECRYIPVRFFWEDCDDNVLVDETGEILTLSSDIYDYGNDTPITDTLFGLPGYLGAPDSCLTVSSPYPYQRRRMAVFFNGGMDLICTEFDTRGDINLNGVAFEIHDYFLFVAYFLHGFDAFRQLHPSGDTAMWVYAHTAATDVNADGIPVQVADLVYFARIMVGDALPYPNLHPSPNPTSFVQHAAAHRIEVATADSLGAVAFRFDGEVEATATVDGYSVLSAYQADSNLTRVIVYSLEPAASIKSGVVLEYSGDGDLIWVETATYDGRPVNATMGAPTDVSEHGNSLPTDFALSQNYPNPFNPTTTIDYALPISAAVDLTIYNINGQRVKTLRSETQSAGYHTIVWDGTNEGGESVSSGIYFYRLTAGSFTQSKKMMLLK